MADRNPALAEDDLAALSAFLAERWGWHFPPNRRGDLEKAAAAAARHLGRQDVAAWVRELPTATLTRRQIEVLADLLTVGETYFFREEPGLRILEREILPELIARRRRRGERRLRIWSAGCCTGEEPYTVAILLIRLLPDIRDWDIVVLGTDVNPQFLRKARQGLYTDWSFRSPPPWLKRDYFTRGPGGRFEILPAVKSLVTFAYHNLAEDACPVLGDDARAADIVLCRNVLMYFEPGRARQVVANIHRCLADDGWLIVSPTEASASLLVPFQAVHYPDAVLYRKAGHKSSPDAVSLVGPVCEFPDAPPSGPGWWPDAPLVEPPVPAPLPKNPVVPAPVPPMADESRHAPLSDPRDEAARLYAGGHYGKAEEVLAALLAAGQGDAEALVLLGRIRANQGRLDDALECCEKAIREDRLVLAAHYLQATVLAELGRHAEAAAGFRRVLYLDPQFALAHFALGNLSRRQGKRGEAGRHFANALRLLDVRDPDSAVPEAEGLTAGRLSEAIRAGQECLA